MLALKSLVMSVVAVAGLGGAAQAHEAWCKVDHIPGHYETRYDTITEPGRWVTEEKVIETPGRYETQCQVVEIPGRWERVERQVWVEGRWVECGNGPFLKLGSIDHVKIGINLGGRREFVPGHYETVCEQVWIPPCQERREVQVWVPGCRKVELVRVWKPGCSRTVPVQVWIPARTETRCVERPQICEPPRPQHPRRDHRREDRRDRRHGVEVVIRR